MLHKGLEGGEREEGEGDVLDGELTHVESGFGYTRCLCSGAEDVGFVGDVIWETYPLDLYRGERLGWGFHNRDSFVLEPGRRSRMPSP